MNKISPQVLYPRNTTGYILVCPVVILYALNSGGIIEQMHQEWVIESTPGENWLSTFLDEYIILYDDFFVGESIQ